MEDRPESSGDGATERTSQTAKSARSPRLGGGVALGARGGGVLGGGEFGRPAPGPALSPRMTAVFGGLLGLATITSVIALLIQVFPVTGEGPTLAKLAAPAESSSASPAAAPAAPKPKGRKRVKLPGPWRVSKLKGSHLMKKGALERRSFIKVLSDAGVPKAEVYRIIKSLDGVRKFDRTGRNDRFVVAMTRGSKKVAAFEYIVSPTEIYQSRTGKDGLLHGKQLDMKIAFHTFVGAFYVGKDVVKSYRAAGLEKGLLGVMNKALNGQTSTEAFEEGGTVRLILEEQTALGEFVRYRRLLAMEYRPPDPAKEPLRAYWFEGPRFQGYVDGKGRRPSSKGWRTPIPGAPVTSHFNPKRMHPVLKRVMPHNGTDFGAGMGTPVYAAYRGKVRLKGRYGASGNLVSIEHDEGIETGYAHLSRFAKGLKVGQRVGTRQLIGYVGSTGRSTGPHLHFSAKRNGKFIDALTLKLDALTVLPVRDRGVFLQQKQVLDARLAKIPLPDPPAAPEPPPEPPPAAEPTANDPEPAQDPDPAPAAAPEPAPERPAPDRPAPERPSPSPSPDPDDGGDDLTGADLSGDLE